MRPKSAAVVLILFVLGAVTPPSRAQATHLPARPATTWIIQGRVYEGQVGDVSHPLEGITLGVYGTAGYPAVGTLIRSTTTNAQGWYGIEVYDDDLPLYAHVYVLQTDSPGFNSVGATTVSGTVFTSNRIEFDLPLDLQDLSGNRFWDARDPQMESLTRLAAASAMTPTVYFQGGIPRWVTARVPLTDTLASDQVVQTLTYLNRYQDLYRLPDPSSRLYLQRLATDDRGGQHVFYGQHVNGLPVFAAELAVHVEGGEIIGSNGSYLPDLGIVPTPAITANQAIDVATAHLFDTATQVEPMGEPRLMLFNAGLLDGVDGQPTHLAWRVHARGLRLADGVGTSWLLLIDAVDGQVLLSIDQSPTSDRPGEDFDIETGNNSTSSSCWIFTTDDDQWFDEDGSVDGADTEGWNAYGYTHQVYHYFYDLFGRKSYDGDEEDVEIYLHVGSNWQNAHYSQGCDFFEFGDGMATLDILVHEFTHGVTHSEADLVYQNQSGALNESMSDVFAAMVDTANWTIGEGTPGGTMRDMSNPPAYSDPDHITSTLYYVGTWDNGGVHVNSGVPNKAAYLIAQGGTHNTYTITGIGRDRLARLYYAALNSQLTKSSQFIDLRNAAVLLAKAFTAAGQHGFTSAHVCSVVNAFASVGVGQGDHDCDGQADNVDPDDDGDNIGDSTDNCPTTANPSQQNTDGDSLGDACDPDDDNDGVLDSADNCRTIANANQADDDLDGKGNVCDDDDGDGVYNPQDNCRFVSNADQKNTDGDSLGNACDPDDDNDSVLDGSDNCPTTFNPAQTNSDGDPFGDACDLCPSVFSPTNEDTDSDGQGDACDLDDDNDGVPDTSDNCQKVPNPDQIDLDNNGVGFECDAAEQERLRELNDILGVITFAAHQPVKLNLGPCGPCPDWLGPDFETRVLVSLPVDVPMFIVDEEGAVVTRADTVGPLKVLTFSPSPAHHYVAPALPGATLLAQGMPFQAQRYYLVIYPEGAVTPGHEYPIGIHVDSGENLPALQFPLFLPIVSRSPAP